MSVKVKRSDFTFLFPFEFWSGEDVSISRITVPLHRCCRMWPVYVCEAVFLDLFFEVEPFATILNAHGTSCDDSCRGPSCPEIPEISKVS